MVADNAVMPDLAMVLMVLMVLTVLKNKREYLAALITTPTNLLSEWC